MKKIIILLIFNFFSISTFSSNIIKIELSDGEVINGKLDLPQDSCNVPLIVVFVPGTGPNTYLNKRNFGNIEFNYFDLFATEFTKKGIGFLTYNRRGVEIGDRPPYYDKIDSAKYVKYTPSREVFDIESIISTLKKDIRFKNTKIALLGASEGTIIASIVADRKVEGVDGLFLFGYANDNLYEIIKWQLSGAASIINLRKYFDKNKDNAFTREEYESTDSVPVLARAKVLSNATFETLNIEKDSVIDYKDFAPKTIPFFEYLSKMIDAGNDSWIWKNYFRVTSKWLKEHFELEANKTRLLRLDIPIFIFQGVDDANTPVEGVYDIQNRFEQANKTNLKCFIFTGHDHDLNYIAWPYKHQISEGLNSIFNAPELLLNQLNK
jgi:pimeloyl-ACP methyl ester carboxylesterase